MLWLSFKEAYLSIGCYTSGCAKSGECKISGEHLLFNFPRTQKCVGHYKHPYTCMMTSPIRYAMGSRVLWILEIVYAPDKPCLVWRTMSLFKKTNDRKCCEIWHVLRSQCKEYNVFSNIPLSSHNMGRAAIQLYIESKFGIFSLKNG